MRDTQPTRRDFLHVAAGLTAAGAIAPLESAGQTRPPQMNRSTVVRVASEHVVRGRYVHDNICREMLDAAMRRVAKTDSISDAWKKLLKPDDVVALKFNSSAAAALATNGEFGAAVVESLQEAGFKLEQIVAIEAPQGLYDSFDVRRPTAGWSEREHDFGSGSDRLAAVLDEVTAIVNIPFLKTHNIAGVTCCLKNLSHALVKHPARYHDNHCSPYIADIVNLPPIRDKLRLNLVNALRIVFDKGPEAYHEAIWDAGIILAGTDPVATDTVGLSIINMQREILGLASISEESDAIYLAAGERIGLGVREMRRIDQIKMRL